MLKLQIPHDTDTDTVMMTRHEWMEFDVATLHMYDISTFILDSHFCLYGIVTFTIRLQSVQTD